MNKFLIKLLIPLYQIKYGKQNKEYKRENPDFVEGYNMPIHPIPYFFLRFVTHRYLFKKA